MKTLEQEGRTTEEAIEEALKKLGITREEAKIEILDEGSRGLFGLVGSKPAKIRVIVDRKTSKVAVELVSKILELMKIEAKIEVKDEKEAILINIETSDSKIIIGKRGQTLNSLQYLVNLLINKDKKDQLWGKIIIDTEDYRKRREDTLRNLAYRLANKVDKTKRDLSLEPMNVEDRRTIHAALQDHRFVATESIGEGINRRVIITPKKR
ncbi:protein jag [bacterium]|nr:protein jag [bacterium]MBU0899657.1 protein jag [bacterium]MBU1153065.1 protein jag [bacterium]MBU1782042.1 protein jag [bacterium]MBU2599870.1 protein jag [bacterium]